MYKIQDVRKITEQESWTRILGGLDLSRIWDKIKFPGKATWTVSTTMGFWF